ncbi:MAG: (Fe-S)-binding protein, partial [Thermoplasmata archaeon]|nr:(Fe-S)-binding protein [Thermoplasmata archaeon]
EILQRLLQNKGLKQNRDYWIDDTDQVSEDSEYVFFTGCIPYLDGIFSYTDSREIGKSALKVFNKAGIKPIVSNDERCCGHNLLWNGDEEGFKKLGELNFELFKELKEKGAKKLVATCAECYRTLKYDYAEHFGEMPLEVIHMSQFMKEMVDSGRLKFKEVDSEVTYQDPCRLSRHSKVYDEPRDVLKSIPGLKLKEMDRIKEDSCCCGVGAYANCNAFTKFIQNERLREAKDRANILVTACPHCRIHLSCYLKGQPIEEIEDMDIVDLTTIAANALEDD